MEKNKRRRSTLVTELVSIAVAAALVYFFLWDYSRRGNGVFTIWSFQVVAVTISALSWAFLLAFIAMGIPVLRSSIRKRREFRKNGQ
jgi:hypothetical protein